MKHFYPANGRVIFHLDANAFFASVEIAENPSLQTKPVIVAGNPKERKGIVVAANYISKQRGIYTTMALKEALKRVPEAIVLAPNHGLYKLYSKKIFSYLEEISPLIEHASIDEAYVDISDCSHLGSPLDIARLMQKSIQEQIGIPVSIGIAPNKFLAKMASDMKKPLGITVLRKRDIEKVLWPRPVIDTYGIGEKTALLLKENQIYTIGDLAQANKMDVQSLLGVRGLRLHEQVNGIDNRPVNPLANKDFKSIGTSATFSVNLINQNQLALKLRTLASETSRRMQHKRAVARTIQITIRYANFETITRSKTIEKDIWEAKDLAAIAEQLFFKHWNGNPVRLIGITAQNVADKRKAAKQLDLFSFQAEASKDEPLLAAMESLRKKFGEDIIHKGTNS